MNEKEIESLVQTVRTVNDDIGIKFGLDMLIMKRGKKVKSDDTGLPDGSQLRALGDGSYRYLSQLESDGVLYQECKERLLGESRRRVKKCFKSKVHCGNMFRAVNP